LLLYSSHIPLGVPNELVNFQQSSSFSGAVTGEKVEDFCEGSFRTHILYLVLSFALIYLLYLHSFYQKPKKIRILGSCFYLSAFSFVSMSNPEVEVRTFKQQGGESLKDAWYHISNSHHRCTKKHSTMILLRNFYVGITSWYRYVLDTLAGGNFLGTPALEACTLIESLVGVPHIHVVKTEVTLEEVL
jgi:hypothetical protein